MDQEYTEQEELYSTFSDFYKEVHGIRPRWAYNFTCEQLRKEIDALNGYMDSRKETFAGREDMRCDGWFVEETDPTLQKYCVWLAEARDERNRELYEYHGDMMFSEGPKYRKAYKME